MPSRYSVIRYVPDPTAGECINIGVVVFGNGRVLYRFVKNWDRVKSFRQEDIEYLRVFERNFGRIREEELEEMIRSWKLSIQFSTPAGSALDDEELLND